MAAPVRRLRPGAVPAAFRRQTSRRSRRMRQPPTLSLTLLPLAAWIGRASASLPSIFPYVPTSLLVGSGSSKTSTTADASVVYIFAADKSGRVDLLSLNVSTTSTASNLVTVTEGVPFLADDGQASTTTAFVPSLQRDGSILVIAGDCSSDGNLSSTAWTISPASESPAWANTTISQSSSSDFSTPWFLSGSLTFSSQIEPTVSDPVLYVYGGMCPDSAVSSAADWQSNATYTNEMMQVVNSSSSSFSSTYSASVVSSKGSPIAEAGFSLTPLTASTTNRSGVITQEISSVLLGGHTKMAFVNMSTAAVWSLPEKAWSYVTISTNTSSASSAPDSRSGHTAVLNEDGTAVIVLGGWVSDVNQAADPQLVVLQLGSGFDDWQWNTPSDQPSTSMYGHGAVLLPGNVMMVYGGYNITEDGNSSTSSSRLARRDTSSLSFLNLTSLTWAEEYTNPTTSSSSSSSSSPSASSSPSSSKSMSTKTKIGLGVGLGVGLALLMCGLFFCLRFCWKRRKERKQRDQKANALAQDHSIFLVGHNETIEVGENVIENPRRSLGYESLRAYRRSHDYMESGEYGDVDYDRAYSEKITFGDYSSVAHKPTRQSARGLYQPTMITDYEQENVVSGPSTIAGVAVAAAAVAGPSGIHPIYEADEEEESPKLGPGRASRVSRISRASGASGPGVPMAVPRESTSSRQSTSPETSETASLVDPFTTLVATPRDLSATLGSRATMQLNPFVHKTPSPEVSSNTGGVAASAAAVGQDRDVQEWVAGLEIEDLLFAPQAPGAAAGQPGGTAPTPSQRGRLSPVRRPSHQSHRSSSSPTRSNFFGAAVAAAGVAGWGLTDDEARTGSNLSDRSAFSFMSRSGSSMSRRGAPYILLDREEAGRGGSSSAVSDTTGGQSYSTAMTGFHALRSEGPGLLYGQPAGQGGEGVGSSGNGGKGKGGGDGGGAGEIAHSGSLQAAGGPSAGPTLAPPQPAYAPALSPGPGEYGGAAAVLVPDSTLGPERLTSTTYAEPAGQSAGEDDSTGLPGSPSKTRRHRSVLGNFFRIFSGSVPTSYVAAATEAEEQAGPLESSSAQPQMIGIHDRAHATLLRRKQGRSDWVADEKRDEENTAVSGLMGQSMGTKAMSGAGEVSTGTAATAAAAATAGSAPAAAGVAASGSVAAGHRDGSGQSEDWDVENAAQSRSVQVMFTVPRSVQLRVVNAEVMSDDDDKEEKKSPMSEASARVAALGPLQSGQSPEEMRKIQDAQLREMEETLAESRRLLEESRLEPWMLEDSKKEKGKATETRQGDEAGESSGKGKEVNLGGDWVDVAAMPQLLQPLRSQPSTLQPLQSSIATPSRPKTPQSRRSISYLRSLQTPTSPGAVLKKRKSGFVLDMVEQIESSSNTGSRPSSRASSPVKSFQNSMI